MSTRTGHSQTRCRAEIAYFPTAAPQNRRNRAWPNVCFDNEVMDEFDRDTNIDKIKARLSLMSGPR